nr:immunoglobulin heavy chain junction region [Macaca mulatta]MOX92031.1 immunoglobulin heavy chain junction region [Macaca mulatta]MOX92102.1 immunoglobulin heavy chain junction region [Macaca mulatta]MOX92571.1 immunoglobulin heavy chain junction region [Macaca mulatta]MOX92609.1 immunoglobulin heavy chain junction region [Macaca mulatta]
CARGTNYDSGYYGDNSLDVW